VIGYLLFPLAVFIFMLLGYTILLGNFMFLMLILAALSFLSIGLIIVFGALWEFYFPGVAKFFIANKRGTSSVELVVDDAGWGEFLASKKYLPEGLIKYKFGWTLLPQPIKKFLSAPLSFGKPPGRKPKDKEKAEERQKEWERQKRQEIELEQCEQRLAENIALKKVMLKGFGKPFWLQYSGLAANFNPYVLVPGETHQDNPAGYFDQFTDYLTNSDKLSPEIKTEILEKTKTLQERCENIRVVLDPRKFNEIHPDMYTESQIDAHGRIHFRLGQLSIKGMPVGKILLVMLIALAVVGGITVIYFMFMKQPQGQPQPSQMIKSLFQRLLLLSRFF